MRQCSVRRFRIGLEAHDVRDSMSKVKTNLSRFLDEVEELGQGLLETLEILADAELSTAIQRGLADVQAGEVVDHEEVWTSL
jgi:hypothetical protein